MSGYSDLARWLTFRPLSRALPDPTYAGSTTSPFSASWTSTVRLLGQEVEHLQPEQTILEVDMREQDLRLDGLPRASAVAASPGVIITLIGTPHGTLRYPCSTFWTWQDNVRGIALALEALRKVDRYGVTKRGEQYAGWKALPSGDANPSPERGRQLVYEHGGMRAAWKATHPDYGGDAAQFADVMAYREQGEPVQ